VAIRACPSPSLGCFPALYIAAETALAFYLNNHEKTSKSEKFFKPNFPRVADYGIASISLTQSGSHA
jgi:hypothetical protein